MANKQPTYYSVTSQPKRQSWIWVITILLLVLGIGVAFIKLPLSTQQQTATEEARQIQTRDNLSRQSLADLTQQNAELTIQQNINQRLINDLRLEIERLNAESTEIKEELVFYQSLLSPSDREPGLHLRDVTLYPETVVHTPESSQTEQPVIQRYRYKIILTQVRNQQAANGRIELSVNTKDRENPLLPVSIENKKELRFNFKYFQSLEGILEVPSDYPITGLIVSVVPDGKRLQSITEIFAWQKVLQKS